MSIVPNSFFYLKQLFELFELHEALKFPLSLVRLEILYVSSFLRNSSYQRLQRSKIDIPTLIFERFEQLDL